MMRNIPFPFFTEETLESVNRTANQVRAAQQLLAKPVRVPRQEIAHHWSEIEDHKWFLSERLGRDVGTQVAAIDYLENISRVATPRLDAKARLVGAFERAIESEGFQAFTNMQRVLHGVPNTPALYSTRAHGWQTAALFSEIKSIRLKAALIEHHARAIEEHKWFLSERLGRNVGTGVAAVDFFANINPSAKPLPFLTRVARTIDRMVEASGPNSIANLEAAMRPRY